MSISLPITGYLLFQTVIDNQFTNPKLIESSRATHFMRQILNHHDLQIWSFNLLQMMWHVQALIFRLTILYCHVNNSLPGVIVAVPSPIKVVKAISFSRILSSSSTTMSIFGRRFPGRTIHSSVSRTKSRIPSAVNVPSSRGSNRLFDFCLDCTYGRDASTINQFGMIGSSPKPLAFKSTFKTYPLH